LSRYAPTLLVVFSASLIGIYLQERSRLYDEGGSSARQRDPSATEESPNEEPGLVQGIAHAASSPTSESAAQVGPLERFLKAKGDRVDQRNLSAVRRLGESPIAQACAFLACIIVLPTILFAFVGTGQPTTALQFESGDQPTILEHVDTGAVGDVVAVQRVRDGFQWKLKPAVMATIDTVFRPLDGVGDDSGRAVGGKLVLEAGRCQGAHLTWSIRVDGSQVGTGVLTAVQGTHTFNYHADARVRHAEFIAKLSEADSCDATVSWEDRHIISGGAV
jgi:hypothetical protein